jgi:hypothetical protein
MKQKENQREKGQRKERLFHAYITCKVSQTQQVDLSCINSVLVFPFGL